MGSSLLALLVRASLGSVPSGGRLERLRAEVGGMEGQGCSGKGMGPCPAGTGHALRSHLGWLAPLGCVPQEGTCPWTVTSMDRPEREGSLRGLPTN